MKTLFIAAGPYHWGSSRMRCWWVAPHMDADVITWDDFTDDAFVANYGPLIFQKNIDAEKIRILKMLGHKIYWDVCDPSWWWEPEHSRKCADLVDGIVASSQELADDFSKWYGSDEKVHMIPDRLDLTHFPKQREHQHADPVRLIWYGVSVNRIALFAALANLERLAANGYRLELTIFDNAPQQPFKVTDAFPIYHTEWNLEKENEILASHDLALLPPYPGPWGRVKSNNKNLTASACGLPVTDGLNYDRLATLLASALVRKERAETGMKMVQNSYQVDQSAREWARLVTL